MKTSTSVLQTMPKPLTLDHNKLCQILQVMGIPDHPISSLRNLYSGQETTVKTGHGTTGWFQIGKEVHQGCILWPCLFNLYAEYIMRNAGLEEAQAGIKISRRHINNFRYADDTTLMAESEEELKSLLMKREESQKVDLKLNIEKTKIMASALITSWHIDGETEPMTSFVFLGSKITADGDCSHEIKRHLLLGASLVAQRLKHLPGMWETWVRSLGWEDPLEKEMATHSSILAMDEGAWWARVYRSQRVRRDWATSLSLSLLLERKALTNLDSILKSRDIALTTKVHLVKAMVFPVVVYGCERWTIKKADHRRIDAFELWCWRRLLPVPWTARRCNQSILKEISLEYSLEGLMLKVKLQDFGLLMWRTDPFEKALMLGMIEGWRRGWQRMKWLDGIRNSMGMSLSKL